MSSAGKVDGRARRGMEEEEKGRHLEVGVRGGRHTYSRVVVSGYGYLGGSFCGSKKVVDEEQWLSISDDDDKL